VAEARAAVGRAPVALVVPEQAAGVRPAQAVGPPAAGRVVPARAAGARSAQAAVRPGVVVAPRAASEAVLRAPAAGAHQSADKGRVFACRNWCEPEVDGLLRDHGLSNAKTWHSPR
jgi:hypothetical protein